MEIITIAALSAFISACLKKAGEKFSEKVVETAFDSRTDLVEKFTGFFKPEIIQLGLNESSTPEEVTSKLEAAPEVAAQATARLQSDPDSFNALVEVLRTTAGRTTNIETLKGNYIEENHGEIHQDIS